MARTYGQYTVPTAQRVLDAINLLASEGYLAPGGRKAPRHTPSNINSTPIFVVNLSGQEIPAFACMQAVGAREINGFNYIEVDLPADLTGAAGPYLFNTFSPIEAGTSGNEGHGVASDGPVARVIRETNSGGVLVNAGTFFKPKVGSWEVEAGGRHFIAIGEDDIETNVIRCTTIQAVTRAGVYETDQVLPAGNAIQAGYAQCSPVMITEDGVDDGKYVRIGGVSQRVYNISEDKVEAGRRIVVVEDRDGRLVMACPCGSSDKPPPACEGGVRTGINMTLSGFVDLGNGEDSLNGVYEISFEDVPEFPTEVLRIPVAVANCAWGSDPNAEVIVTLNYVCDPAIDDAIIKTIQLEWWVLDGGATMGLYNTVPFTFPTGDEGEEVTEFFANGCQASNFINNNITMGISYI